MTGRFATTFEGFISDCGAPSEDTYLAVSLGDDLSNWFVGIDDKENPCILVESASISGRQPPPIKLENLEVQFHVPCKIERISNSVNQSTYSVMRLKSTEAATREVFFSVCDSIIMILGNTPKDTELSKAMQRLAAIFLRMLAPPSRTLSGLFGELALIYSSLLPHEVIKDWRETDEARYDFSSNDLKVEVKSTSTRRREHEFSYEQCSPPVSALGLVASVYVERASRGTSIRDLQELIEAQLLGRQDVIFKLREVIAESLGAAQGQANSVAFDLTLATESIAFYDLKEVPAIRIPPPVNVTKIRFVSDLSESGILDVDRLSNSYPFLTAYLRKN